VHDGTLDHALEAKRRLGVHLARAGHGGGVVADEVGQGLAQVFDVDRAGAQHFGGRRVVEKSQQQMLNGDEFMPCLPCFDKGHV